MTRCLAVDPGNISGWALFVNGLLTDCGVWHGYPRPLQTMSANKVLIEMPQFYRASLSKGDPNDLAKVCVGVGKYSAWFEDLGAVVTTVKPSEWKGQLKKEVHHPRIWSALCPLDQTLVSARGKGLSAKALTDLMDAVGLGFWAIKTGLW